jgi:hypothetical protein
MESTSDDETIIQLKNGKKKKKVQKKGGRGDEKNKSMAVYD